MVAKVKTVSFKGIDVVSVDVQVQVSSGLPNFQIVGLPDKTVAESRERIRAVLSSLGLTIPAKRITVNLAPADLQKEGSHYDLPIILALLIAIDVIKQDDLDSYVVLGELSLDGSINNVSGILPAAMYAVSCCCGIICPFAGAVEASWASPELEILGVKHLLDIVNHFNGSQVITQNIEKHINLDEKYDKCFSEIKGQALAKRALEISASGNHHILMIGPPGAGKSMLASRLPTILPRLTAKEALEVSMIYSVANELNGGNIITKRPFRDPHHSSSLASFIGGGIKTKPGEISLAHRGVLFLDELPEFNRTTLESLRQPLENGYVIVARANNHVVYPAKPLLVAAMNPCKCGYLGNPEKECNRTNRCSKEYFSRISGPLLDRIDIHINVPAVNFSDLSTSFNGETSEVIAKRVEKCREIQRYRYQKLDGIDTNGDLTTKQIDTFIKLDDNDKMLLNRYAEQMQLSARSYYRLLKIIRTIADMDMSEKILTIHVEEALNYKN